MNPHEDPMRREGESEADALIAARLRSLLPPAGLKERILASRPALPVSVPVPHFRAPRHRAWATALTVLLLGAVLGWLVPVGKKPSFASYEHDLTGQIVSGQVNNLNFTADQVAPLKEWLAAHHAPANIDVPAGAQRLPSVGCRTFVWNGKPVSQICFALEDGKIVHLFVIGQGNWHSAPPEGHPEFAQHGEWTMACWREAGATYVLAGIGDQADLEKLFL